MSAMSQCRRYSSVYKLLQDRIAWSLIGVFLSATACTISTTDAKDPPADATGAASIDSAGLSAALSARISQRASENGFKGTVLVSRDGEIVLHRTFGALDSSSGELEPAYWVASGTKQFMGAVIALLVSNGTLELDVPIGQYLDGVPIDKSRIALRQLLTHTSGLGQRYAAEGVVDRAEAAKAILRTELIHAPGTNYSYSNDGFTLAAIIAEVESGQSYEVLMRTLVFEPVGLTSTGLWGFEGDGEIAPVTSGTAVKNQASTIYSEGLSRPNWGYRGATGIYSTATDLSLWLAWLLESGTDREHAMSQVISPEQFVREVAGLGTVYYGLGIAVVERDGSLYMISHIGDDDWLGHNSSVTAYVDGDIIVVLSNSGYLDSGTPWSAEISREIRGILGK